MSKQEGNFGFDQIFFTVTLDKTPTSTVRISYATSNGTAGEGDYNPISGVITFAPGQTTQTIAVTLKGDTNPLKAFDRTMGHPDFQRIVSEGAKPIMMLRLACMNLLKSKGTSFYAAASGDGESPLDPVEEFQVQDWLEEEAMSSLMVMQVHDELVLEVREDELERVRKRLPELMAGVAALKVPLLAEVGVGPNWEQAH